jgi:membrane dipeptidase
MPKIRYPFVAVIKMLTATIGYIQDDKAINIVHERKQIKKDKLNIILGVEGGHIFDNSFKQVEALYDLGVRVFTLTWNNSNQLACSALDKDAKGLTKKGKQYIQQFKALNAILDLSHTSTQTVLDVCEHTDNPIMASHSCVRALNPSFKRNIDDTAIDAIKKKGGVIGVNFSQYHLGKHTIIDHIDYLEQRAGIGIAAIGSDFDGINDPVIKSPAEINVLTDDLSKKGYSKTDIANICSENFLRIFK